MIKTPKVNDIDADDSFLVTKARLTKNEYSATVRNKHEYNRLKVFNQHINDQSDTNRCKFRTSVNDLKKRLGDNQQVVCNIDEYFINRKVQSATPHPRSRPADTHSNLSRPTQENTSRRTKSASTTSRSFTEPLHETTLTDESIVHVDTESDDDDDDDDEEVVPVSDSRLTSGKLQYSSNRLTLVVSNSIHPHRLTSAISSSTYSHRSSDRLTSAVSSSTYSHRSSDLLSNRHSLRTSKLPSSLSSSHRITWPVKIKVFALQDENDSRQQYLAWRADQRKTKVKRSSIAFFDPHLEKKYQESIRRRKEIEAYVTPQLIEEHQLNDPIFAKRYRQLKLAIRAGRVPTYDPADREIHLAISKSKIERTRTELITVKQTKMKNVYRNQQKINDAHLSKRVDTFLKRLATFKEEQEV